MCNLNSLSRICGSPDPPGTKQVLYWIPKSEIEVWPATAAENAGTDAGDTKLLDEAWDVVATVGLGYWRRLTAILPDTGQVTNNLEGPIGGQGFKQRFTFFLQGNGADVHEWLDELLACSGCIIVMVPTKAGTFEVLGDLDNGVFVEAVEGGTGGDRVGFTVTLFAAPGLTTYLYDADTYGIDITPNV